MRVLVTGGAGFIGSTLADRLVELGHAVAVVDDLSAGRRAQVPAAARLYTVDVAGEWLARVVERERPAAVLHLAAQIEVRASVADPRRDAEINVLGTVNVLTAAAAAGVSRVVLASSGGTVYGEADRLPTPEDEPTRPASPYGAAKLAIEGYGSAFHQSFGVATVSLRLANVYGPRQSPRGEAGVVAIFAERLLRGEPLTINGDGLQTRDYVYVDDVVAASVAALELPPGAYNVGTGRETTVLAVHDQLARLAGRAEPARHGPDRPGDLRRSALDCGRLERACGWRPQVALAEGLRRTLAWVQSELGPGPTGPAATRPGPLRPEPDGLSGSGR